MVDILNTEYIYKTKMPKSFPNNSFLPPHFKKRIPGTKKKCPKT